MMQVSASYHKIAEVEKLFKRLKRFTFVFVLLTIVSLLASVTAMAKAELKKFDYGNGNYVTISNVIQVKQVEDVGYGTTQYVATAPVTVTFHGKLSDDASIAQWVDEFGLNYIDIVNNQAVLTEEAEFGYGIFPVFKGEKDDYSKAILVKVVKGDAAASQATTAAKPADNATPATPTAASVQVNGTSVSFEAYNIGGSNFFKLRDLAIALNGTEKNFEVKWDAAVNAINLISGQAYTPVGNELAVSENPTGKKATETTASLYFDGKPVELTAYNIDGSNYFKLRDIAKLVNFGVTWDADAQVIGIDTGADYEE
jgi:hypothetical protein